MECVVETDGCGFTYQALDADYCRFLIYRWLHPDGVRCPHCGADGSPYSSRLNAGLRALCLCGKWYSAVSGTWLSGCKLDPRKVYMLAFLVREGFSDSRIAEITDMDRSTVWAWRRKLENRS